MTFQTRSVLDRQESGKGEIKRERGESERAREKETDTTFLAMTRHQQFALLVASLCPGIFGHEAVKAGLLLALFGGTQRYQNDKKRVEVRRLVLFIIVTHKRLTRSPTRVQVRGDTHVLVVGDPGMGKSQMLKAVTNVAPRGVYVCGNTASATGLTVSMARDAVTGEFSLEAGAVSLLAPFAAGVDYDASAQTLRLLIFSLIFTAARAR